jgi:hypothetical protein
MVVGEALRWIVDNWYGFVNCGGGMVVCLSTGKVVDLVNE